MNIVESDIRSVVEKRELFAPLADKRILVTGATGLIGSMLIKTLIKANDTYDLNINIIGQIRNSQKAKEILEGAIDKIQLTTDYDCECNYIVHTVSPTTSKYFIEHPVETIKTSVESCMMALAAAQRSKATMVYLSSMEQYGVPYEDGDVMTEDKVGIIDHLTVRSSYSESKRLCECLCKAYSSEYGVDVKIARLAQTFGAGAPFTDNRMPMQFARAVAEARDIVLHTEGRSITNFVYLTDAITAILLLLHKGESGQAYNVCNDGESRSVRQVAELVAREVAGGRIGVAISIPADSMGYAPDVHMYLNSDKLRGLGWRPEVDMSEAYRRLAKYVIEA